jgi:hypothetical protein
MPVRSQRVAGAIRAAKRESVLAWA